ncbi:uncharacterized protein [Choristoneura fumiferana]|uniref:uncharacterized protein n=1 Tax=Choristoneura fumiferana TaxID=7141 RepID=UPI003D15EC65
MLYAAFAQAQRWPERVHNPSRFRKPITKFINGTDVEVDSDLTPDWRVEETPPGPYIPNWYMEMGRPYRLSPFTKQADRWNKATRCRDRPHRMGCYCCTVYKRLTPLATCAVITTRHLITTATSTELVLKDYGKRPHLENILGAWYDRDGDVFNSSMYMTPARIHYHPEYVFPQNVNSSHPIPSSFDLAVWAATYPFVGSYWYGPRTYICNRAGSHMLQRASPFPGEAGQAQVMIVVGFQFMWYYKKVPMPWFKYAIKTRQWLDTCPKSEWGHFICLFGRWASLGIDSGAALHRISRREGWMEDGLLGLGAFSMTLRAPIITHYFTPLENHPVLDFLYAAYMGTMKYRYLDNRFYDTKYRAPYPKPWHYIPWLYPYGDNNYYDRPPLWFKK